MSEQFRRIKEALERNERANQRLSSEIQLQPPSQNYPRQSGEDDIIDREKPANPTLDLSADLNDDEIMTIMVNMLGWFRDKTGSSVSIVVDGEKFPTFESTHKRLKPKQEKTNTEVSDNSTTKSKRQTGTAASKTIKSVDEIIDRKGLDMREDVRSRIKKSIANHLFLVDFVPHVPLYVIHEQILLWDKPEVPFDRIFMESTKHIRVRVQDSQEKEFVVLSLPDAINYIDVGMNRSDIGLRKQ